MMKMDEEKQEEEKDLEESVLDSLSQYGTKYPKIWKKLKRFAKIVIIIPIAIWLFYYLADLGMYTVRTSLTVGAALSTYASFLAFSGSIILSSLALYQNRKIKEASAERQMGILRLKGKLSYSSNILFRYNTEIMSTPSHVKSYDADVEMNSEKKLSFVIENFSDVPLQQMKVNFGENSVVYHISLHKEQSSYIQLDIPKQKLYGYCEVEFLSCYGVKSYAKFDMKEPDKKINLDILDKHNDMRVDNYIFRGINHPGEENGEFLFFAD